MEWRYLCCDEKDSRMIEYEPEAGSRCGLPVRAGGIEGRENHGGRLAAAGGRVTIGYRTVTASDRQSHAVDHARFGRSGPAGDRRAYQGRRSRVPFPSRLFPPAPSAIPHRESGLPVLLTRPLFLSLDSVAPRAPANPRSCLSARAAFSPPASAPCIAQVSPDGPPCP